MSKHQLHKFKVGDRVAFENRSCAYTVTVVKFMLNGNFIGRNPIYTRGGSRKYVTDLFTLFQAGALRDENGRFTSAAKRPFTENTMQISAKYTNSRHPATKYFAVSLGGERVMLSSVSGALNKCVTSSENPEFWAAFSIAD